MTAKMFTVEDYRAVTTESAAIRVTCTIHDGIGAVNKLWFEVHGLPHNSSIDSADAFLAPCILFALKHRSGIRFEVPISDSLARQAEDVAFIFGTQLTLDRRPQIEIPNTVTLERKAKGGITGFSGGVDSWFALKKTFLECRNSSKKLTYLLVNDVGANTTEHKKQQVLKLAEDVAKDFNLGIIQVKSNMNELLAMDFQKTHTARNASVAHLLTSICDTFYYSSADTYANAGVFPTYDMAYADTIILPLLSGDSMTLCSSGSSFSRAEKTREIIDIPGIGGRLDVCVRHGHNGSKINCGDCWKCLRTELTLEAFGALPQFEPVFDLDAYRKGRKEYIRTVSLSHTPTEREVFELARVTGLVSNVLLLRAQATGINSVRRLRNSLRVRQ